ncbi:hypothetical protein [Kocuria sp.]|uniref:hypothetical protein n=1 Tax=Kocuria sp. TaxID=1871328 RepID=UPI0026DF1412|nr:hypothetical protein [Kocuria sp.]MDO5617595.1 hypothetical protein [Kocuria sp.]
MTYGWYPQQQTTPSADPGLGVVVRHGKPLPQASAHRCWAARLIDAALITVATCVCMTGGAAIAPSAAATAVVAVLSYPAALLFFGVLYGLTVSPGQLLTGVISLRAWTGRRVGAWRGAWRYLGVGLAPFWAIFAVWSALTSGNFMDVGYAEPVRVVYRRIA